MKSIKFNEEKDEWLKKNRNVGFEDIRKALEGDGLVKKINNPNKKKYPKQKLFLIKLKDYIFMVPFVEESEYFFLKTIIPSRKYTKQFLKVKTR